MYFHCHFVVREKTLRNLKLWKTNNKSVYIYVSQQNVLENVPEAVSSISQIEQEDISEWGVSDAESVLFKPQDTLEIQPTDESSKPLEGEQPIADSKAAEQMSLKVKSYLCWKQSCESWECVGVKM